jgi:predicted membrane chloride channel (bestrophin family)
MLVAYPILALDQIGVELQNPFPTRSLSHLPLDEITGTIQRNLLSLLSDVGDPPGERMENRSEKVIAKQDLR